MTKYTDDQLNEMIEMDVSQKINVDTDTAQWIMILLGTLPYVIGLLILLGVLCILINNTPFAVLCGWSVISTLACYFGMIIWLVVKGVGDDF